MSASLDVFVSVETTLSPEALAGLFGARGWRVRRCTLVDWEAICPGAELVIEAADSSTQPGSSRLVHGVVDGDVGAVMRILAPLTEAALDWHGECYVERRLVQEIRSSDRL